MGKEDLPSRCFSCAGQFCEMGVTPDSAMREEVFKNNNFSFTTVGLFYQVSLALFKRSHDNIFFLNKTQCFPDHCLFREALKRIVMKHKSF